MKEIIKNFTALLGITLKGATYAPTLDPSFPTLISFPRAGSHWLRIILEVYSDQPLLNRSFFTHFNRKFLLIHSHDLQLIESRKKVIYLHREPVNLIFSLISYYQQDLKKEYFTIFWLQQYLAHLSHWIFLEEYSEAKTVLSYEDLTSAPLTTIRPVLNFLNLPWDQEKLNQTITKIDKAKVAQKTKHDQKVINDSNGYPLAREEYKTQYGKMIKEEVSAFSMKVFKDPEKLPNLYW